MPADPATQRTSARGASASLLCRRPALHASSRDGARDSARHPDAQTPGSHNVRRPLAGAGGVHETAGNEAAARCERCCAGFAPPRLGLGSGRLGIGRRSLRWFRLGRGRRGLRYGFRLGLRLGRRGLRYGFGLRLGGRGVRYGFGVRNGQALGGGGDRGLRRNFGCGLGRGPGLQRREPLEHARLHP
jgi:hypothetical protein